jgi:dTDP-4-dehydrorhamnose 3,5-epimerase
MEGVTLTPLKIISNEFGSVMHALKKTDVGYYDFGEAYFSTVEFGIIKGWKKHSRMILNFVVPMGKVRFVVYDERDDSPSRGNYYCTELSSAGENYQRLTIRPGLWVAFEGLSTDKNILLNIASILHDPSEAENSPVRTSKIPYPFSK